jgi:hypothetical protein
MSSDVAEANARSCSMGLLSLGLAASRFPPSQALLQLLPWLLPGSLLCLLPRLMMSLLGALVMLVAVAVNFAAVLLFAAWPRLPTCV